MGKVRFDITASLDGFVAGPDPSREEPLGKGGEQLHEWVIATASWRESHGHEGGVANVDSDLVEESIASTGAVIMGRRMFSGEDGPWGDPPFEGWWGDDPPFHVPVFVLTHHPREQLVKQGGTSFTFVTNGIEAALEQARSGAGDRDVLIAGGGDVVQQYLRAGLVDEFQVHVAPLLLGAGTSLFGELGRALEVEPTRVVESPAVTHLRYRVVR